MAEIKHIYLRMPAEYHRRIRQAAAAQEKSMNAFCQDVIMAEADKTLAFWLAGIKAEEEAKNDNTND